MAFSADEWHLRVIIGIIFGSWLMAKSGRPGPRRSFWLTWNRVLPLPFLRVCGLDLWLVFMAPKVGKIGTEATEHDVTFVSVLVP